MCILLSKNSNLCIDKNTRPFKNTFTASSFDYVKFAKWTTYIYKHVIFTMKYIPQVGAKITYVELKKEFLFVNFNPEFAGPSPMYIWVSL